MARTPSASPDSDRATEALPIRSMKFETALAELEEIVQTMEGGQLPLEDAITAYRRGTELLAHCQEQLREAEQKIRILEEGTLRDFDRAQGDSR